MYFFIDFFVYASYNLIKIREINPDSVLTQRKVFNMKNVILSILILLMFACVACLAWIQYPKESQYEQERLESQICKILENCD